MQYRSKRRGFHNYVKGQIKAVGKKVYGLQIGIKLEKQEVVFDTVICTFNLDFDNSSYQEWMDKVTLRTDSSLPIRATTIFEMFPFCLLFTVSDCFVETLNQPCSYQLLQQDLVVTCLGSALRLILPQIIGKKMPAFFELVKPLVEFKFDIISARKNNVFELATQEELDKLGVSKSSSTTKFDDEINLEEEVDKTLHIKGQMIYIDAWQQMLFLACPIMKDLNNLIWTGLFVNDLRYLIPVFIV